MLIGCVYMCEYVYNTPYIILEMGAFVSCIITFIYYTYHISHIYDNNVMYSRIFSVFYIYIHVIVITYKKTIIYIYT